MTAVGRCRRMRSQSSDDIAEKGGRSSSKWIVAMPRLPLARLLHAAHRTHHASHVTLYRRRRRSRRGRRAGSRRRHANMSQTPEKNLLFLRDKNTPAHPVLHLVLQRQAWRSSSRSEFRFWHSAEMRVSKEVYVCNPKQNEVLYALLLPRCCCACTLCSRA